MTETKIPRMKKTRQRTMETMKTTIRRVTKMMKAMKSMIEETRKLLYKNLIVVSSICSNSKKNRSPAPFHPHLHFKPVNPYTTLAIWYCWTPTPPTPKPHLVPFHTPSITPSSANFSIPDTLLTQLSTWYFVGNFAHEIVLLVF